MTVSNFEVLIVMKIESGPQNWSGLKYSLFEIGFSLAKFLEIESFYLPLYKQKN